MLNIEKTKALQKGKYLTFIKWCKENGAIISDEVLYPSAFGEQGFMGLSAKEDIPGNKIIIAIPNKLIISYQRVLKSELAEIFSTNKLFDQETAVDAEFNCLALYIFYNKLLGSKSFWYPYFEVVDQHTMFEWKNRDLFNLQDQALIDEFMFIQQEMDKSWYKFKGVMNKYPQFFGQITEIHKDMFYWSNEFVMTRCFGYTLPSTSLVPFADMLNHSNINPTTYHLVNRSFEMNGKGQDKYTLKSGRIDMRLLDLNEPIDPKYQIRNPQLAYIETNKELLIYETQTNREKINQINYNVLKLWKEKQPWELDYESSSESEDNDSDSDEEEREDKLQEIRKKEIKILQQRNSKEHQQQMQKCSEIISSLIPQNTQYKKTQSTMIKGRRNNDDDDSDSKESSSSDDSEKDFDWYQDEDSNTYFCITTAGSIKKGDQIYTFYGRRNNRFLLLWYGFAMNNNKYNSYIFRVQNCIFSYGSTLNLCHQMIKYIQRYQQLIVLIRIILNTDILMMFLQINQVGKSNQRDLNYKKVYYIQLLDLIIYIRLFLMQYYNGSDANSILLTIPVSIDFEIQVFDFTIKFLSFIAQKFKTTYQEDITILEEQASISGDEYFALAYRVGQKEQILLQINHVKETLKLLMELKQQPKLNIKEYFMSQPNSMEKMRPILSYIKFL